MFFRLVLEAEETPCSGVLIQTSLRVNIYICSEWFSESVKIESKSKDMFCSSTSELTPSEELRSIHLMQIILIIFVFILTTLLLFFVIIVLFWVRSSDVRQIILVRYWWDHVFLFSMKIFKKCSALLPHLQKHTFCGRHPQPGNGRPSEPKGQGASKPGTPCSPLSPRSPLRPRFPIGPASPLVPFSPRGPSCPGMPSVPYTTHTINTQIRRRHQQSLTGNPGSPLSPLAPVSPCAPCETTSILKKNSHASPTTLTFMPSKPGGPWREQKRKQNPILIDLFGLPKDEIV